MRLFGHWLAEGRVRLFVAEQAGAGVLFLGAFAGGDLRGPAVLLAAVASVGALQIALYLADLYVPVPDPDRPGTEARWLAAAGTGSLLATLLWTLPVFSGTRLAQAARPGLLLALLPLSFVLALVLRALPLTRPRRVLVLGTGRTAREVARILGLPDAAGWTLCGFVDDGDAGPLLPRPGVLGTTSELEEVARRTRAELLVVATGGALPEETLARARAAGLEVASAAGLAARALRRVPSALLGPAELVWGEGFPVSRVGEATRRALDLAAAAALLLLSAPVLAAAAIAIRLDSRGPIFYSQERTGRDGLPYLIRKLRTMRPDAEADGLPRWAQSADGRVTRVGRWLRRARIDEIPQLFAIFAGHMSLVGPRPERPFFVEQLERELPLYRLRAAVRPGVTGWAQINYPYGATVEDARAKLEYDLYWVRHRSVFLYLSVVFHTVRTVVTLRGAR